MRRLPLLFAVGGTALVCAVAGCGSKSASVSQPVVTVTSTPTATPSGVATAPTSASPSSSTVSSGTGCSSADLRLGVGAASGAAGTSYLTVVLTNVGSSACTLAGYLGVSFTTAGGTQLGVSAKRVPGTAKTVSLKVGASASAYVGIPEPGNFQSPSCKPAKAAEIKVFPPGQTQALTVASANTVCTTAAGRTTVTPLQAGVTDN